MSRSPLLPTAVHTVACHSPCHYRLPSQFKTPLLYLELVIISLFCTQTRGSTEGEVRKRPLAAQIDDDRFTTPWLEYNHQLWHTARKTRQYQTCLVSDETEKQPHGQTAEHQSLCERSASIYSGISAILHCINCNVISKCTVCIYSK